MIRQSPQEIRKAIILHMRKGREYTAGEIADRIAQSVNKVRVNIAKLHAMGLVAYDKLPDETATKAWRLADREASE